MRGENTSFEMLYEGSSKIRAAGEHRCIFEIVNATQCKSMKVNVRTERQKERTVDVGKQITLNPAPLEEGTTGTAHRMRPLNGVDRPSESAGGLCS